MQEIQTKISIGTDVFGKSAQRVWDPKGVFEGALLKVYENWCLEVSFMQHTLGCCIIFSRHPVEKFSELEGNALKELGKVTGDIERAMLNDDIFKPDRFNYLQMGNALHHLHIHGIPRYASEREFGGQIWRDKTYGWVPEWNEAQVSRELVSMIREKLVKNLLVLSKTDS